ncbi:MAG: hypothetical protein K0R57_5152 [Paenibacillaceae bacterium]|jgi:hypothetical protein|nr:hypothetical protein [Paenibacillaceae bacterium]
MAAERIVFEKSGSTYSVDITPIGIFTSVNGGTAAYTTVECLPRHGWVYYISKDAVRRFFDEIGINRQDVIIVHDSAREALEMKKRLPSRKRES